MRGEVYGRWEAGGREALAAQLACTDEGPTKAWEPQGTRGARTSNMWRMVVTLDVSKLSG